jgi:hypothetical protein
MLRKFLRAATFAAPLTAALLACGACSTEENAGETGSEDDLTATSGGEDAPIAVPPAGTTLLDLTQPKLLEELERVGYGVGQVLGTGPARNNAELEKTSPRYASVVRDIEADLAQLLRQDPKLKTEVANFVTRIMDKGWLKASYANFELVGVVNRADQLARRGGTTCGEVRLLYRLAYNKGSSDDGRVSYSRLPFFLNAVFEVPRRNSGSLAECTDFAKKWVAPSGLADAEAYVSWLRNGPLALSGLRFMQLEVDGQVLRVPSEIKRDMGGHAEYFLRVYRPAGDGLAPAPLENTPDVERLTRDNALRAELVTYLRDHVREIDDGTIVLPEKFLATKVTSFTTYGSARIVNRPFTRLFYRDRKGSELAQVPLTGLSFVRSVEGLVTRLDQTSCVGCHGNAGSTAGFHFIGEDRLAKSHPLNVVRIPVSPHYLAERPRRRAFMQSLLAGTEPSRRQPLAIAGPSERGTVGAACLPDTQTAFSSPLGCAAGLSCELLAKNAALPLDFGQCLPARNASKKTYEKEYAGLPCLGGEVKDQADPRQDTLTTSRFACPAEMGAGYTCRPADIGVPGGLCTNLCANGNVPRDGKNELCAYAGGKEFDECAGSGDFSRCLAGAIKAGLRQACDEANPCREDYICQKFIKARATPPETPADGRGYCVPTYFLFQVRTDGHPNPTPIK